MQQAFDSPEQLEKALNQARIRAKRLIKQLRSSDETDARRSAARFAVLPRFESLSDEEIHARRDSIRLKDALNVVAKQIGFRDWTQLKLNWEASVSLSEAELTNSVEKPIDFLEHSLGGFLHLWFGRYEEAKRERERNGGYLLPAGEQYFLADTGFIAAFGLDPDDPDWERIGYDWIRPLDPMGWNRLAEKARQVQEARRLREQAS